MPRDKYSLLHSVCHQRLGGKYKYVLTEDLTVYFTGTAWPRFQELEGRRSGDTQGRCWVEWGDCWFRIKKDYASDGCSPKRKILGRWLGTPDFDPETIAASFIHDALYQTMHLPEFPLPVELVDQIFYQVMRLNGFNAIMSEIYFQAVRRLGPPFYKGGSPDIIWLPDV